MKLLRIKAERVGFLRKRLKIGSKSYKIAENYNLLIFKISHRLCLVKWFMIKVLIVKMPVLLRYLKRLFISSYGKNTLG